MKKRLIFRLVDLAVAAAVLALSLGVIFIGPDRPTAELFHELLDYLASISPELVALLVCILVAGASCYYLIVDVVVLVELYIKYRQYKRMGIPGPDPNNPCNNCPNEEVCVQCPYNPLWPGGKS